MENVHIWIILLVLYSPVIYHLITGIIKHREELLFKSQVLLRYLVILLTPVVILFVILWNVNILDYESPKPYSEIDSISFKNFRGLEFFKKELYGNPRFAYIVTSWDTEITDEYVEITSYFHPSKSYVYNSHISSKELLTHELYHFKITEAFARKIKKSIHDLESYTPAAASEIIRLGESEMNEYQKNYDFDTFHSYVYSEQIKYQNSIDSMLLAFDAFKNPKLNINE